MRTYPRDGKKPKLTFKKVGDAVLAREGKRAVRLPLASEIGVRVGKFSRWPSMVLGRGHNIRRIGWDEETPESLARGTAWAVLHKHGLDRSSKKTLTELVEVWDADSLWKGLVRDWRQSLVIGVMLD